MQKQNGQIGIRIPKDKITKYNNLCLKLNSIMSLRIRKFIDLELDAYKNGRDILKELENGAK